MFAVKVNSLDGMLRAGLQAITGEGEIISSSRGPSREVRNAVLQLSNPLARVSRSAQRGQFFGALGEFSWYLGGLHDIAHVKYYIQKYEDFIGDGSGAYGPRLFGHGASSQIETIIQALREKGTTRKAVIQILTNEDLRGNPLDVPCTCTLQFMVRNNAVELTVYMRSNDVMLGMPFDVFSFTMIQEIVARALGKELGPYTHMVGSLHLYKKDVEAARTFLDEGVMIGMPMPPMPKGDPGAGILFFRSAEHALRNNKVHDFSPIADQYWLDLVDTLAGLRAYKNSDNASMREVRARLHGSVYDLYLTDQHWKLEQIDAP
jgi:thymidylate synthase